MQCNWGGCNAQGRERRRWYRRPVINITQLTRYLFLKHQEGIFGRFRLIVQFLNDMVDFLLCDFDPSAYLAWFHLRSVPSSIEAITFWKVCTLSSSASSVETKAASSSAVQFRPSLVPFLIYKISHLQTRSGRRIVCVPLSWLHRNQSTDIDIPVLEMSWDVFRTSFWSKKDR